MRRNQQGFVFITALFVIAGLVALIALLAADQRASLEQAQNVLRARRSEAAARSAVAQAIEVLSNANANIVKSTDDWAQLGGVAGTAGAIGSETFDMDDGSTFRVQVIDASSLVDVNTASATQLQLLPLTQDQIDSLLDWRSAGTQPRPDGAKDTYYNGLTQPYNTRLGLLTTLNELLLIKGWTANLLYEPPVNMTSSLTLPTDPTTGAVLPLAGMLTVDSGTPNTRVNGSTRVNLSQRRLNMGAVSGLGVSQALARQIVMRGPFTSFRAVLSLPGVSPNDTRQILNGASFTPGTRVEGKINLNTATQPVLQTLANVTPDIASAIVSQQAAGFNSLGDMTTVPAISNRLVAQLADSFNVASDTWIIRAYGQSGGVGTPLEVVVRMINNTIQVVTWNKLNTTGIPSWWGWVADATTTTEAGTGL